jgi:hypothetical protein
MMKLWQRRILGLLAVGGGAAGATASVTMLLNSASVVRWAIYTVFACLYAWGVWCGVKMFEGQPNAEKYHRRFWLIQVPALNSPLIGYSMVCGFHLTLSLDLTPFKLGANFSLGSMFNFSLFQWNEPLSLGVNVFALGIFLWMAREFPDVPASEVQSAP